MKKVILNHKQMVEVLQILHTVIKVSIGDVDMVDEVEFLKSLVYDLLDNLDTETDPMVCIVELSTMQRFSLWLVLDKYVEFTNATNQSEETHQQAIELKHIFCK